MTPTPDNGIALRIRVPAKLNLFLSVQGRRPDGYHELVTVFQTVSVYDELRVALIGRPGRRHHPAGRRRMRLELWTDPGVPHGPDNLVYRAALQLGALTGVGSSGGPQDREAVRTVLDLDKRIPMTAGLAGGSADAAAALIGLNRLWGCGLTLAQLRGLGAELGSDVPFCMTGGTALGRGRGTDITPVLSRGPFHWVVWPHPEPLSTAEVYRAWDHHGTPTDAGPDDVLRALHSTDPRQLAAALHNDLEQAAFALRPELVARKQRLLDAGALGVVLAGSGPTLLALTADRAAAEALAARIAEPFGAGMDGAPKGAAPVPSADPAGPSAGSARAYPRATAPIVAHSPAGGPSVTPIHTSADVGRVSRTLK